MGDVLTGCAVWLTRPAGQASAWADGLMAAGARVTIAPLLEIRAPSDADAAQQGLAEAATADVVIATSANAVAGARALAPDWAPSGRLIAVGQATAAALTAFVGTRVEVPQTSDSEGLLALLDRTPPTGRRIAILAGEGGREALADGLVARGARVARVALYRRAAVALDTDRLDALLHEHTVLVVTSSAAWQALVSACDSARKQRLSGLSLVAPSLRVVQHTDRDIDWQYPPVVIDAMDAAGAQAAVTRAWLARR
ncbi:uroporphyrinogen-III synthase [Salinisphaera sp. Q1T1-3]|uniref:uroporphyrinogen-III synthase n=1 Tax=Salinisphaera sp. Q1T1-3 TaxID=2321229 RepID=UPI000E7461EF|nr:uroporphyrinogen-III synthase [Salinisphaera sp. Q1T1-3]RJS91392.1 uroporphyrinogen-III synthase [Salinisphaera sp. Q1T1-3]